MKCSRMPFGHPFRIKSLPYKTYYINQVSALCHFIILSQMHFSEIHQSYPGLVNMLQ